MHMCAIPQSSTYSRLIISETKSREHDTIFPIQFNKHSTVLLIKFDFHGNSFQSERSISLSLSLLLLSLTFEFHIIAIMWNWKRREKSFCKNTRINSNWCVLCLSYSKWNCTHISLELLQFCCCFRVYNSESTDFITKWFFSIVKPNTSNMKSLSIERIPI